MPATFVAERATLAETSAVTAHPFVPTGTLTAGNLAVVVFGVANAPAFSIADDGGNTWAFAATSANGTSCKVGIAWSVLANNLTTGNTVTVTTTSFSAGGVLWEYSGITAVSPADQIGSTSGVGNSMTGGTTGTLAQADELVIAGFVWTCTNVATFTTAPGSGYTQPSANEVMRTDPFPRAIAGMYGNVSSPNAVTPDFAETTSSTPSPTWAGVSTTFEAAAVPAGNRLRRWRY